MYHEPSDETESRGDIGESDNADESEEEPNLFDL